MAREAPQYNPPEPSRDEPLADPSRLVAKNSLKDLQDWVSKGRDHDKDEDKKPKRAPLSGDIYPAMQPIPEKRKPKIEDDEDEGFMETLKRKGEEAVKGIKERLGEKQTAIDVGNKEAILARLDTIKQERFDAALAKVSRKEINRDERNNAKILLDGLAQRMFYEAVVSNWSVETLKEAYAEEVDIQRDKAAGGSLFMEAGRKIRRAWNAAGDSMTGDALGMEGTNEIFSSRGDKQLIATDEIQDVMDTLGFDDIQTAIFEEPLNDADDDEVDSDRREFIENNILPGLGYQTVAKVAVENYPVGDGSMPAGKLELNVTVQRRFWRDSTEQRPFTPKAVAYTHALRTYIYELINARNTCFVGAKRTEMESKQAEEKEKTYNRFVSKVLKTLEKI